MIRNYYPYQIFSFATFGGLFLMLFVMASCGDNRAQKIVDRAIDTHGGEVYKKSLITFDFRNLHYTAQRNDGLFKYTREFDDSTGIVVDVLQNDGFLRMRNGGHVALPDSMSKKYTASVNSVIYFAALPFGLNDPAVQKEYIGETTLLNEPYEKVSVTFQKESGGEDFQDEFVFWIHQQKYTVDYFAYSYVVDGGGMRFREATNQRNVNGLLFSDYYNYAPPSLEIPLVKFDSLFEAGAMKKLSEIKLENIEVQVLED